MVGGGAQALLVLACNSASSISGDRASWVASHPTSPSPPRARPKAPRTTEEGKTDRSLPEPAASAAGTPSTATAGETQPPSGSSGQANPGAAPTPPAALALITASPQPTSYALVVGIESYRDAPPPLGARRDAEQMAQVFSKTLGLRAQNVHVALDSRATKNDVEKELDWLMEAVPHGGRVYFFFSGHGSPDASGGSPYLVPYDGDPKYLEKTSVSLAKVLSVLSRSKAREALVIVDSCFSGAGGRSILPPGARPLVRVHEEVPTAKVAVFSASSGAELSGPSSDRAMGAFTKFVAEGLGQGKADMDGDGQLSLQELETWVSPRVAREAKLDNREQHPTLRLGGGVAQPGDFIVAWGVPGSK
jgi:hypothetical protein